jgi:hypothetical protein
MSTDYGKLIARVRDESTCTDALHRDLADAVEVLVAENGLIYESWKAASTAADEYEAELVKAEREREVLRNQFAAATAYEASEWGVSYREFPDVVNRFTDRDSAQAHVNSEDSQASGLV